MNTTSASMLSAPRRRVTDGRVWRVGLLAAAVAAGANALVYTLARAVGVALLIPPMPGAPPALLPLGMVLVMSVVGAAAGTAACVVLDRLLPGRPALFPILGLVALLLSFGLPLSLGGADGATKATLLLMHIVAGGSIIGLLSRLGLR